MGKGLSLLPMQGESVALPSGLRSVISLKNPKWNSSLPQRLCEGKPSKASADDENWQILAYDMIHGVSIQSMNTPGIAWQIYKATARNHHL